MQKILQGNDVAVTRFSRWWLTCPGVGGLSIAIDVDQELNLLTIYFQGGSLQFS